MSLLFYDRRPTTTAVGIQVWRLRVGFFPRIVFKCGFFDCRCRPNFNLRCWRFAVTFKRKREDAAE